jgi:hypothetical protein
VEEPAPDALQKPLPEEHGFRVYAIHRVWNLEVSLEERSAGALPAVPSLLLSLRPPNVLLLMLLLLFLGGGGGIAELEVQDLLELLLELLDVGGADRRPGGERTIARWWQPVDTPLLVLIILLLLLL